MLSVQTNLSALNSGNILKKTASRVDKSSEKLNTGYKINRAADDAAGLSISEKMRAQIRGLSQASDNAQEGNSLIQVADGAMAEVQALLQRCTELTVKSANGTTAPEDRAAIQAEINQILDEINAISQKTEFNTKPLLLGSDGVKKEVIKSSHALPSNVPLNPSNGKMDLGAEINGTDYSATATVDFSKINSSNISSIYDTGFNFTCCTCDHYYSIQFNNGKGNSTEGAGQTTVYNVDISGQSSGSDILDKLLAYVGTNPNGHYTNLAKNAPNGSILYVYDNRPGQTASGSMGNFGNGAKSTVTIENLDSEIILQLGSKGTPENQLEIELPNVSTLSMGIDGLSVSTERFAKEALALIEEAGTYISSQRSNMGAYQNRLEHTIDNLDNVIENTQAAESQIRDTDMATEMVSYSKDNIMKQAGQAMLAQANKKPEGILKLLS